MNQCDKQIKANNESKLKLQASSAIYKTKIVKSNRQLLLLAFNTEECLPKQIASVNN